MARATATNDEGTGSRFKAHGHPPLKARSFNAWVNLTTIRPEPQERFGGLERLFQPCAGVPERLWRLRRFSDVAEFADWLCTRGWPAQHGAGCCMRSAPAHAGAPPRRRSRLAPNLHEAITNPVQRGPACHCTGPGAGCGKSLARMRGDDAKRAAHDVRGRWTRRTDRPSARTCLPGAWFTPGRRCLMRGNVAGETQTLPRYAEAAGSRRSAMALRTFFCTFPVPVFGSSCAEINQMSRGSL